MLHDRFDYVLTSTELSAPRALRKKAAKPAAPADPQLALTPAVEEPESPSSPKES